MFRYDALNLVMLHFSPDHRQTINIHERNLKVQNLFKYHLVYIMITESFTDIIFRMFEYNVISGI